MQKWVEVFLLNLMAFTACVVVSAATAGPASALLVWILLKPLIGEKLAVGYTYPPQVITWLLWLFMVWGGNV